MSMNVWGYGDASLIGGDLLVNVATATAYPTSGPGTPTTGSFAAQIAIEPNQTQLGVFKAFGTLKSGPGQTTPLNLTGSVQTAAALPGNVVMTDLLPLGLSWANPSTNANFSVTKSRGGAAVQVAGTLQDIRNFNGTGQELIRITLPSSGVHGGLLHDHRADEPDRSDRPGRRGDLQQHGAAVRSGDRSEHVAGMRAGHHDGPGDVRVLGSARPQRRRLDE